MHGERGRRFSAATCEVDSSPDQCISSETVDVTHPRTLATEMLDDVASAPSRMLSLSHIVGSIAIRSAEECTYLS